MCVSHTDYPEHGISNGETREIKRQQTIIVNEV